jgi:Rrf2 family transcriptional regulator, iron-sulfur cluster assembly transcription factor
MTVLFSKKCELALQALLFLSVQEKSVKFSAQEISERLKIPKEFVSKVLQSLTSSGIVGSQKGKNGGFYLEKSPKFITLWQIVEIIDGSEKFNNCVLGFPGCSVATPCPVHNKWGKMREDIVELLRSETLEQLREKSIIKIDSIG